MVKRWNKFHSAKVSAAEPPLTSIGWGKGCDSGDGWERVGGKDELCDVGVVVEFDCFTGVVVHNNAYFTTVVVVDDSATNVDVFEGEATARFDGACDGRRDG